MRINLPTILLGLMINLAAMAIYFLIESAWGKKLEPAQLSLVIAIAVSVLAVMLAVAGSVLLSRYVNNRIRPAVEMDVAQKLGAELLEKAEEIARNKREVQTGIVEIFDNFPACEKEILHQIENSSSIRIFVQIGKTVLSGATDFWDHVGKVDLPRANAIRILHASTESPYLDERRLHERGSDQRVAKASLAHAGAMIEALRAKHKSKFDARRHKEPYIWRLFIFDEVAYAQPYLYPRFNARKAPVLKVSRLLSSSTEQLENPNSLYKAFVTYFDSMWKEYEA